MFGGRAGEKNVERNVSGQIGVKKTGKCAGGKKKA